LTIEQTSGILSAFQTNINTRNVNDPESEVFSLNSNPLFPRREIESKLRSWWKRKADSPLRRKSTDARINGGTVFDIQPDVSSTEAVEVFLEVEPLLGFEIKSSKIIKLGGYRSSDEFVQHLLPQLEAKFSEIHPAPVKPHEGRRVYVGQ